MAKVWTTRFIRSGGSNASASYVVPAGHRAVIKSIVAMTYQATIEVWLSVGGTAIWVWAANPAATVGRGESMTVGVFAGETISTLIVGTNGGLAVSGFLFVDDTKLAGTLPSEPHEPQDPGWPWEGELAA